MSNDFIANRITELRISKNISEFQLSLDLGYSKGYIQSITSGRALPSMKAFLEICSYFSLSPSDFFKSNYKKSAIILEIEQELEKLSMEDLVLLVSILKRIH